MKIVFLAWRDLANPLAGGSEVLVDRLAAGLVARGHNVTLIAGGPVGERPYEVIDAGGVMSQYLRAPAIALRRHRDADVVVDVCNGIPFFTPLWRRRPTICLVNHVHTAQWSLWFPPGRAWVGRLIESRVMPLIYRWTTFMAVSPSTAEALVAIGVPEPNIAVIPNGVELPASIPPKSDQPLFLALGRLVPHKQFDLLLRTWNEVQPTIGGKLVIAGEGPELSKLRSMAGEGASVVGFVTDEQRDQLLGQAWLLIHPAMLEGWGLVIMEAAARGTPTLGFRAPGVRDAVLDGESGILVDDETDLRSAWLKLAEDSATRARLCSGASRRAEEFSWDLTVERLEALAKRTTDGQAADRAHRAPPSTWRPMRATLSSPAVSLIVPAMNEAERLADSLRELRARAIGLNAEIIVVDDGSSDETDAIARVALDGFHNSSVIRLERHRGKGAAVRAGVAAAAGPVIVFLDADLSADLADLDSVIGALDGAHIAVGSRAAPGSRTSGGATHRALMGRAFNSLARTVTGVQVHDFQCGFKAFRGEAAKLLFQLSELEGYAFDVEVLSLAHRIGYQISEVPIRWTARDGSHIRPVRDSSRMAADVLGLPFRWSNRRLCATASIWRPGSSAFDLTRQVRPLLSGAGPVVPWEDGSLAFLPFLGEEQTNEVQATLYDQIPGVRVVLGQVSLRSFFHARSSRLRDALASAE